MARDYKREYETYHKSAKQKRRRAQRNSARAKLAKAGKVSKGDGKDVDHKNKNTGDNSVSNLRVKSKSANRADNRGKGGRPKLSKGK
jgi:hypothetical protein